MFYSLVGFLLLACVLGRTMSVAVVVVVVVVVAVVVVVVVVAVVGVPVLLS